MQIHAWIGMVSTTQSAIHRFGLEGKGGGGGGGGLIIIFTVYCWDGNYCFDHREH